MNAGACRYEDVAVNISQAKPPSNGWLIVCTVTAVLATACWIAAFAYQYQSTRPISEGDVFLSDAAEIGRIVESAESAEEGVRRARNRFDIEAVSLVNRFGLIVASTSQSLDGHQIGSPLLQRAVSNGRVAALAVAVDDRLEIDGVEEWPRGSILYQVVAPLESGDGHILLHYDLAGLLARRAKPGEILPVTLELLALGLVFATIAVGSYVGHSRSMRRYREMVTESELLRAHSRDLEDANRKLAEARRVAEIARDLAEEKMRIRSEFVLMINHELRTPLTSVVTGAELVRAGELSEDEQTEVIESIVAHGRRLTEIIDQILAVARIENRGLNYELGDVPLYDMCVAVEAHMIETVAEDISVRTDVGALSLVVSSLVENAHTHGASQVEVRCDDRAQTRTMVEVGHRPHPAVYLTVSDNGPGIDLQFLPRVFEKFEKKSYSSGTGLGLYMVRLMVDALGGSIGVTTSPTGTTFQIVLPAVVRSRVMETV